RGRAQGVDRCRNAGEWAGVVRGQVGDGNEALDRKARPAHREQARLAAVDDPQRAIDEALAADLEQGFVAAAEALTAPAGEDDCGDPAQVRRHGRRTRSRASPARRPQKAPPMPSRVMPEAVVTKVAIAGSRVCSSVSEVLSAAARLGSKARPATASIRIGGDAAMKLAASVEPRPRSR